MDDRKNYHAGALFNFSLGSIFNDKWGPPFAYLASASLYYKLSLFHTVLQINPKKKEKKKDNMQDKQYKKLRKHFCLKN